MGQAGILRPILKVLTVSRTGQVLSGIDDTPELVHW